MRTLMLVTTIMVAFAPAANAEDCAEPISQKAMTDCAKMDLAKADAKLNANYALIKERLKDDAATPKLLLTAQRTWLKFRDAECTFSASGVVGGSIYNFVHTQCLTRLTQARVRDLEVYVKCQEGDLSCPISGE